MKYIGEHLIPGQIGQAFVVLSFVAALLAFLSFTASASKVENREKSWLKLARTSFWIHGVSVLGIVISLFFIIYNHYFEYHYAWSHSSLELPTHYIISCFWEGQEGSFLLWTFWHVVLGGILIFKAKSWEAPVLSVISFAQLMLSSMLLGYYFLGYKIGSSPFILLRDAIEAPIFQQENYLSLIKDGNGLNPLLQNYWMVIHPPVLFLGFAATIVPFAYAIAALWKKAYKDWLAPALPWALFGVMILGTGILMGGMWAYEALSFGGYWAWDPVENASLVPWLTLIGGTHLMIVYKNTNRSASITYALILVSFILILYATFLTRSGILGESSVHAFTDLGMSGQLLAFLFVFCIFPVAFSFQDVKSRMIFWAGFIIVFLINVIIGHFLVYLNLIYALISIVLIFYNFKKILPQEEKEESVYSREFWMFIGTLVLTLSALHIVFVTSFPVFNKLFGLNLAPPVDPVESYNRIQLPIAILIILLTVIGMLLKYRKTNLLDFLKPLRLTLIVSVLLTALVAYFGGFSHWVYITFLFSAFFGIVGNGFILKQQFRKIKISGGAVAHVGFGIMLVGILFSSAKKEVISINNSGMSFGKAFEGKENYENVLLWKDSVTQMGDYLVEYQGDSVSGPNNYYLVNYKKLNEQKEVEQEFTLYPNAQINPKMGLIANPDSKHYWSHDLFTHVTQVIDKEAIKDEPKYKKAISFKLNSDGDTILLANNFLYLQNVSPNLTLENQQKTKGIELAIGANLFVKNVKDEIHQLQPVFAVKNNLILNFDAESEAAGIKVRFNKFDPEKKEVQLSISEKNPQPRAYIIMKALKFPYINLLWGGMIILIIGFLMAIFQRRKLVKD